jgi:hypothetical protein
LNIVSAEDNISGQGARYGHTSCTYFNLKLSSVHERWCDSHFVVLINILQIATTPPNFKYPVAAVNLKHETAPVPKNNS